MLFPVATRYASHIIAFHTKVVRSLKFYQQPLHHNVHVVEHVRAKFGTACIWMFGTNLLYRKLSVSRYDTFRSEFHIKLKVFLMPYFLFYATKYSSKFQLLGDKANRTTCCINLLFSKSTRKYRINYIPFPCVLEHDLKFRSTEWSTFVEGH